MRGDLVRNKVGETSLDGQTVGQPNSLTIPIEKEPEVSLENEKHIRKTY